MALSEANIAEEISLMDKEVEDIPEKETECADELWAYIKAHRNEVEDLEEYAQKRGLV